LRMASASNLALSAQRVRAAAWANSHSSLLTQALPLRMQWRGAAFGSDWRSFWQ